MSPKSITLLFFTVALFMSTANAQYGWNFNPYNGYQQIAYNSYNPEAQHSQAPSPAQQQEAPAAPSTNFSFGSTAYFQAKDMFGR